MRFRRKPNPNRNHPEYCPFCASTVLFPDVETEFAWSCSDCRRVFSVMFHGQDEAGHTPNETLSSSDALKNSLAKRGHFAGTYSI